jgi:hypothetical protein
VHAYNKLLIRIQTFANLQWIANILWSKVKGRIQLKAGKKGTMQADILWNQTYINVPEGIKAVTDLGLLLIDCTLSGS